MSETTTVHFTTSTAAQTQAVGRCLGERLQAGDVLILDGPLGAGKTTLTQGIADGLGVRGPITSPTFVVSREHPSLVGGPALVHVDAYRLAGGDEVDALDLESWLDEAVIITEWGKGVIEYLSDTALTVRLQRSETAPAHQDADDARAEPRIIELSGPSAAWADRLAAVGDRLAHR